jgi:integrase
VLKAACRHAYQLGWIDTNLSGRIRRLPEENQREVYLTAAQVEKLAKAAPTPACAAAIMIAAYGGLRASEILALTPASVRLGALLVERSKGGNPRLVPIAKRVRPHLSALPIGLDYWQLYKAFDVAREGAGLAHVHFHDLRHTAASFLVNKGVDLYVIGKILGHASPLTTQRYAHLADTTLRAAIKKIG